MRILRFALVAAVGLGAASGQVPAAIPAAIIEGKVFLAGGQPAGGADIEVDSSTQQTASDGTFKMTVSPGVHVVKVSRPGYVTAAISVNSRETLVSKLAIRLDRLAVIGGRVLDPDSNPVAHARVTVYRSIFDRGARRLRPSGDTQTTDSEGRYRIAELPPGRYYLRAEPIGHGVTTYYPSTIHPDAADSVLVDGGDVRGGIDIRQVVEPVFRVRGTILSPGGRAAAQAALALYPDEPILERESPLASAEAGAKGAFEFSGLLPGAYILRAAVQQANQVWVGRFPVMVGYKDLDGLEFRLKDAWVVAGSVEMDNGAPLPGTMALRLEDAHQTVSGNDLSVSLELVRTADQKAASFRREHIQPEMFYVSVELPPNYYVRSVTADGSDVSRMPLDLTAGGVKNLHIVLATDPLDLRVNARTPDSNPAVGATVVIWPDQPDRGDPASGVQVLTTNPEGVVHFPSLRPETYHVAAFDYVDVAYALNLDFLQRIVGRSVEVHPSKDARTEQTVTTISAADAASVIRGLP